MEEGMKEEVKGSGHIPKTHEREKVLEVEGVKAN